MINHISEQTWFIEEKKGAQLVEFSLLPADDPSQEPRNQISITHVTCDDNDIRQEIHAVIWKYIGTHKTDPDFSFKPLLKILESYPVIMRTDELVFK